MFFSIASVTKQNKKFNQVSRSSGCAGTGDCDVDWSSERRAVDWLVLRLVAPSWQGYFSYYLISIISYSSPYRCGGNKICDLSIIILENLTTDK